MKWGILGAALLVAATTTGCGGKPEGCIPLDPAVARAVVDGGNGNLRVLENTGQAIKSDAGVYYAAYRINAAGSEEVGVWALDSIAPPGAIRSVNGYAQQFTDWPTLNGGNGSQTARDAEACLD